MPSLEALERRRAITFNELLAGYVSASPEMSDSIRRGVAEVKAGKTRPWSEVKRDLGLG